MWKLTCEITHNNFHMWNFLRALDSYQWLTFWRVTNVIINNNYSYGEKSHISK